MLMAWTECRRIEDNLGVRTLGVMTEDRSGVWGMWEESNNEGGRRLSRTADGGQ